MGETGPSTKGVTDAATVREPIRVLLVEDDETDFVIFKGVLSRVADARYEVQWESSHDDGLRALERGGFDIVVLDHRLGSGSDAVTGLDFLREASRRSLRFPVLLLTGAGSRAVDLQAMELGAADYVSKLNLSPELIERSIRYGIERFRAQNQIQHALSRVEESRRDLLSILNRLRIGTAIADADGRIAFVSGTAQRLIGIDAQRVKGESWEALFPGQPAAVEQLRAALTGELPEGRDRIAVCGNGPDGRRFDVEVEVMDDPRDEERKIFAIYDVSEVHDLRRALGQTAEFFGLIGRSAAMQSVYEQIRDVANVDATVLIEGETGTGKELVARAIHFSGRRKNGPFIPVNCAGLTESLVSSQLFGHRRGAFTGAVENSQGLFEAAEQGTLFLDEIGDVPMSVQATLLRVLQDKQVTRVGDTRPRAVDVRFVAASQSDLQQGVEQGRFRADLLYRIRVARVTLPPLRERTEDIPLLCQKFLEESRVAVGKQVEGFSREAMDYLTGYAWPGNVRELRSAAELAVIRSRSILIKTEDLPPEIQRPGSSFRVSTAPPSQPPSPASASVAPPASAEPVDERTRIVQALDRTAGNRTRAARLLGVSRATFYRRLKELGIEA